MRCALSARWSKAVKAAATTFRANPAFDTEKAIMELGIGEALVSTLDEKGQPTMVQKTLVKPPNSRVGPITDSERKAVISASPVKGVYDEVEDRESAYEILQKRTASHAHAEAQSSGDDQGTKGKAAGGTSGSDGFWATFGKTIVRSVVPAATRMLEQSLKNSVKRGTLGASAAAGAEAVTDFGFGL